jgi:hypothetical protein
MVRRAVIGQHENTTRLADIASVRTIERRPPRVGGRLRRRKPASRDVGFDTRRLFTPRPRHAIRHPARRHAARGTHLPAQTPRTLPADVDAEVTTAMRQFEVPGLAIAVVKDGRMVFAEGYGIRRLGDPTPVDALTLFQRAARDRDPHERGVGHQHGTRQCLCHLRPHAAGTIDSMKMVPVSPLADFSFDYQDLLFTPVAPAR